MKAETFTIRQGGDLSRLVAYASALIRDKAIKVTVAEHRNTRSDQQNRFLWMTYQYIIDQGGEAMAGWEKEDLHQLFLGEHFGWEKLSGFGMKRMKPIRRSSKLTTVEFIEFVEFIQRYMAERGVYLPDPNEELACA